MNMTFQLVGASFRPKAAQDRVLALVDGEGLIVVRDPSNAYDSNAVAIHAPANLTATEVEARKSGAGDPGAATLHLGFVPSAMNRALAGHLDEGGTATCHVVESGTRKPLLEIEF